jgi:NAD dependent epimerase/dehydratase
MKVLVTGAGGFIGSHLVESLIHLGKSVKAFVHYNSRNSWGWLEIFNPEIKKALEIFTGDICDPFSVKEAMKDCDLVYHLAALISIPYSFHSPKMYVDINVKGTLNVLQAARELGVQRVIHTSTSEVYGTALFTPITEDHPLQGQSPYAASKIGADHLALSFYRTFNLPVIICRPFNTYGPRQSARAVIPTIILQIASGRQKIELGALHPTRDFSYIQDTVEGFLALAEAEEVAGEVLNLGSGFEVSIGDTALLIAEIMGVPIEFECQENRLRPEKSEVERLLSSNQKMLTKTKWIPRWSGKDGLQRGLSLTIDWFLDKDNSKYYKPTLYNI